VQEPERVVLGQIFDLNRLVWHDSHFWQAQAYRQSGTAADVRGKKIGSPWQVGN
jgi:hypothetical protein